ncbi:MAG: alpha/beta hydrolase [Candidatus Aminicenantes bacterium]|nr:alpha/beta hydrolase [Candidatus Aminicenantes bacterium]
MIRTRVFIGTVLLILPMLIAAERQAPPDGPRIEWAPLPAPFAEPRPDARTGYLIVPERRETPRSGRTIRLPFLILKSRSASPRPDPVFFTAGGPGGSTLSRTGFFSRSPLRDDRDIILLEQRGNRFAEPALMGPEIDRALRSGWGARLNGDPDPLVVKAALSAAARSLKESGIDPTGYTTKESAADIAELRRLLGIEAWNLYGVSYGTKLILTILRDHPEGVRAVILDSVLPLEANCDEETPANILVALNSVFAVCREDERLRERFPDLRERFFRLLAEANRHPIEIETTNPSEAKPLAVTLDGVGIMNCVYNGLEDSSVVPRLPLIIDAACRGEYARLAPLAKTYLGSTQGTAWGMRISVWCNEELPFMDPKKVLRPSGLPPELARFIQPQIPWGAQRAWPRGHPAEAENRPVRSFVPTLIAAGEFDPDTPTKWAHQTAGHLPNARLIEFAGFSHAPLFGHPEAARIMREFLAVPSRTPEPGKAAERPAFRISWEEPPPN